MNKYSIAVVDTCTVPFFVIEKDVDDGMCRDQEGKNSVSTP